jgi:hypothetical protein
MHNNILAGEHFGNHLAGRSRRNWEDNIKLDLREMVEDGRVAELAPMLVM